MILITFALPHESGRFLPMLEGKTWLERGALPIVTGNFQGREIAVIHVGMGPQRATDRTKAFLGQHRPKLLIAAGYAGGLDERLATGRLIIGENFTDPSLIGIAGGLSNAMIGKLTTQALIAETTEAKKRLAQETGALAVDMETGAIYEQCEHFSVPMLSVRAISDPVGTPMPVPTEVWFDDHRQKPRILSLLAYLGTHPSRIPPFARFVGGTNLARKELTEFLCAFLRQV